MLPHFNLLSFLYTPINIHLAAFRGPTRFWPNIAKIHSYSSRCFTIDPSIVVIDSANHIIVNANIHSIKPFDLLCRRRLVVDGICIVVIGLILVLVVVVVVVLVNVIKRANGIATNGQNVIIQLEGTICRYNPNLSKVDLSRKIGPNFYNKQEQQRRH